MELNMKLRTFGGMLMLGAASMAHAEPYMGLQVGSLDYDLPNFDKATSVEVLGGYKLNENFGVELNYVDFGDSEDGMPPVWTLSGDTFGVAARFIAPLSDQFELYGRLGMHTWSLDLKEEGYGTLAKDDGTDTFYGVGVNFNLSPSISLGAGYTVFNMDQEDATIIGGVLQVSFP
jgi:OmpA-OmpF porin, OOP family